MKDFEAINGNTNAFMGVFVGMWYIGCIATYAVENVFGVQRYGKKSEYANF